MPLGIPQKNPVFMPIPHLFAGSPRSLHPSPSFFV